MDIQTLTALEEILFKMQCDAADEASKWIDHERIFQFDSGRHVGIYDCLKVIREKIKEEDERRATETP